MNKLNSLKYKTLRSWEIFILSVITIFGIGSQYFTNISYSLNQGLIQSTFDLDSKYLIIPAVLTNFAFAFGIPFGHIFTHRLSFKKNYILFTAIFLIASIFCASTNNIYILTIGKTIQGLSTGVLFFTTLPQAYHVFPAKYKNVFLFMVIVGLFGANALGGVSGSYSIETEEWRWLYYVNIASAILCILIASVAFKDDHHIETKHHPYDTKEVVALTIFAVILATSCAILPIYGMSNAWFITGAVLSLISFILFVIFNLKSEHPIVHFHTLYEKKPMIGAIMAISSHLTLVIALAGINIFLLRILRMQPHDVLYFYIFFLFGVILSGAIKMLTYSAVGAGVLGVIGSSAILYVSIHWRIIGVDVSKESLYIHAFLLGFGISITLVGGAMATLLDGPLDKASHRSNTMHTIRNYMGAILVAAIAWFISQDLQRQIPVHAHSKEEAMKMMYLAAINTVHHVFHIMIAFNIIMLIASIIQMTLGKGRRIVAKKVKIIDSK
ncbi:MFS transporter [Macrococcus capreoli]|uniref:MFS transporter n=1 Tax=Macrococcus capreoli TaxID=2982690 RepID=UPI0021D5D57D|nr:MFS transporter [Macrococcus sp. TMW 2.2395]MCU7557486.1 MFS transporter [Macrococcus sp. TMW 2.2395]